VCRRADRYAAWAKWHLWHGCPYTGLQRLESLGCEFDADFSVEEARLLARLEEYIGYLENNQNFILNYGDRNRHGEPITSSFVESAVNQVVSTRFCEAAADGVAAGSRAWASAGEDVRPE
jgi:hypothetical protein